MLYFRGILDKSIFSVSASMGARSHHSQIVIVESCDLLAFF
jgi:hypothetical protein